MTFAMIRTEIDLSAFAGIFDVPAGAFADQPLQQNTSHIGT